MKLKILIIILSGLVLINQAIAQEQTGTPQETVTEGFEGGSRIIISTSGPAKFSSYWLDNPPRLVVNFRTRNILSKIDNEVVVNQGVIKRITSNYSGRGRNKSLKSLTFELTQEVPYKIWQENNSIILDIQTPLSAELEAPLFFMGSEGVSGAGETTDIIIKRLEAMDATLMGVTESPAAIEIPKVKESEESLKEINKTEEEIALPKNRALPPPDNTRERKTAAGMVFSLVGLTLISGAGFFTWRRRRSYTNKKLEKLKAELQEKDKRLEQEEILRKAIERASLQKEKEYGQLRNSFESLRDPLMKMEKELSPARKKGASCAPEKPQERRSFPRLSLTRDFNKTVIIRIESPNMPKVVKSFANNISSGGLCFETKEGFKVKNPINLRLFFYGGRAPMIKIRAKTTWKKIVGEINHYGVSFSSLDEKDKSELNSYIESKMAGR